MLEANREQDLEGCLVKMARGPLIYGVGKYQVWTHTSSIIALSQRRVFQNHTFAFPFLPSCRYLLSMDTGVVSGAEGASKEDGDVVLALQGIIVQCSNEAST